MLIKYIKSIFSSKEITSISELKQSLINEPNRHITSGPMNVVDKSLFSSKRVISDFHVYIEAKKLAGHVMSLENVHIFDGVVTVPHFSIHKDFRGKSLGQSCIESLIKLLQEEVEISIIRFTERLGYLDHYVKFFEETLSAKRTSAESGVWEVYV